MEKEHFVSVIIPSKRKSMLYQCLRSLEKQTYPTNLFEVIVISPENFISEGVSRITVKNIVDVKANQAEARNIAEKSAKGDILAFCDDDCVLPPNWIENGVRHFSDSKIATVGGPSIPPLKDVELREIISGLVMMSFLGTGSHRRAHMASSKEKPRLCKPVEIICANMFVDRLKFREIGGFDGLVPQEEDRLNTKFVKKGYKLVYDPKCINIHRQRPYGVKFIRNIFWLMTGQGSLTMDRLSPSSMWYLIPSFFTIGLIIGPLLFSFPLLKLIYIAAVAFYVVVAFAETLLLASKFESDKSKRLIIILVLPFVFFLHHIVSGFGFIFGFFRQVLHRCSQKVRKERRLFD